MDLLEDIKRELRGDNEPDDGDSAADGADSMLDDAESDDTGTGSGPVARSTTASGPDDESVADGDETRPDGAAAGDSSQGDDLLCSFCETEFDASRDVCPECDAEIVLRGAR
ncbi:hypothetical protein [Halorussus salinus]|uniref:hypothetical protein n=1 Tax=Halorussus salinus TaxID=1364935 RepID=UPI0010926486|nr:hypothetical protein [Halorussus salinus]